MGRCYIWYRRRLEFCHIWNHINQEPAQWQDSEILCLDSAHFSLLATPTNIYHNISDSGKVVCALLTPRKDCCFDFSWRTSMFLYYCQKCEITEEELQPSCAIGGNDGSVIKISWASNQPGSPALRNQWRNFVLLQLLFRDAFPSLFFHSWIHTLGIFLFIP